MIKEMKPLSMAEGKEIIEKSKEKTESEEEALKILKKFTKLKPKKAKELREKLENLDILKLKEEYIVKIMDILPENAVEVNKISPDLSLNEDEIKKILEIVKQYR